MAAMGQGGDAAQQGQNGGGEGDAQQQQAQPDFGALSQQLEQLAGGQEELRQFLASNPAFQQQEAQQQEAEPASPEVDLSWLDPADPAYDPEQVSQRLTQTFDQHVQQATQQAIAPLQERLEDMQREQAVRDFVNEFPQFAQDDDAQKELLANAKVLAEAHDRPELASEPWWWRVTHLAHSGLMAAQQEGVGTPEPARLEGGGGAVSGASQVDPADVIMNAGGKKGASVLPFH